MSNDTRRIDGAAVREEAVAHGTELREAAVRKARAIHDGLELPEPPASQGPGAIPVPTMPSSAAMRAAAAASAQAQNAPVAPTVVPAVVVAPVVMPVPLPLVPVAIGVGPIVASEEGALDPETPPVDPTAGG